MAEQTMSKSSKTPEKNSLKHEHVQKIAQFFTTSKQSDDPAPQTFTGDKNMSREAGESSHTVITEHIVGSFSDSEMSSPKHRFKKKFTSLFNNSKHSGHPDAIPEDKKLSREAVESFSDSEVISTKRGFKKRMRHLIKNSKRSDGPDTLPGDKKLSREAGESSHTVITEHNLKTFIDSEAGLSNRGIKKKIPRLIKKSKHSGGPDTLPGDKKLSMEAGECSHTVITEKTVESLSGSEANSPKRGLGQKMRHLIKKSKHSGDPDTVPGGMELSKKDGDKKLSREAGESSHTLITEHTVETLSESEAKSSKCGFKAQITRLIKNSKDSGGPDILPEVPVLIDFNQNLELNRLAEASQQLLAREEQLFSSESADEQVVCSEEEEERLKNDYETLELHLWMAIKNSFNKRNEATLKSAVTAIVQEEERDRLWEEVAKKEHPIWRPMKCREWHDILLQKVVDKRMQLANREKNVSDNLSEMSVLIQNDLFYVVKDLQGFYPPEFEICHMYAQLYHQVFTKHLRKLPRLNIPIQDCMFILGQISNYSNNVLHHSELESDINSKALEPLLSEEDLDSLEEQYLSHKEGEIRTLLFNVLKLEEQNWQITDRSHLTDGYYCTLALDTIHFVDSAIEQATALLSKKGKAQRILFLLPDFLASYKNSIEELLKSQKNISEILKANLFSVYKLRQYIKDRPDLPEHTKTAWLSTTVKIRDSCHKYFLGPIHDELKVNYSMLWTAAWFTEHCEVIEELENKLIEKISYLWDLYPACLQELLGQLHFEVMIKYVGRMLKRKLKLTNKEDQEKAADLLCQDSSRINTLFIENGSDRTWLCEILPKVSEVLKVQDPDALELEVYTLLKEYPDITIQSYCVVHRGKKSRSENQVCAILQLKTNVSCADRRMIKECYHQSKSDILDSEPAPPFFCQVPRNFSLYFGSCFCTRPSFHMKETLMCNKGCYSVNAASPV